MILFALIMMLIIIAMRVVVSAGKNSEKYTGFAQCLADKGVKFYGAFWCSHCQEQKASFGAASRYLPYVECSNPDRSQNEICNAAGIRNLYPTWVFPDGTRHEGGITFKQLAEKSSCSLN